MPKTVTDETLTVAHFDLAADFYNRYPGEALTIYLRFTAPDLPDAKVQLSLPKVMEVESYDVSPSKSVMQPATIEAEQELIILIRPVVTNSPAETMKNSQDEQRRLLIEPDVESTITTEKPAQDPKQVKFHN